MRPLLFLDVDGTIHALVTDSPSCQRKRVRLSERPRYRDRYGPIEREVLVPVGMRERVLRLAEAFHVVWASAWRHSAPKACSELLDVPAWPSLTWRRDKAPAMVRYAASRPFAWADDQLEREMLGHGPYEDTPWPENGYALAVNPRTGLTDNDAETLLRFAERIEDGSHDPST